MGMPRLARVDLWERLPVVCPLPKPTSPRSQPPAVPLNQAHVAKPATKTLARGRCHRHPWSRQLEKKIIPDCGILFFFFPLKLLSPPKQFFFFIMEETKARVRTKELALMVFIPG